MFPFLVADIGGTNARFALVMQPSNGAQPELCHLKIMPGVEFPTFSSALNAYLSALECENPTSACIAIASPIDGDRIEMTHLPWSFSIDEIKQCFGFKYCEVMNDFNAVALGVSELTDNDIDVIKTGAAHDCEPKAIIGPGTGLGVSGLTYCRESELWLPISGLGGHINLAATTSYECDLIRTAMDDLDHVSAELMISGTGMGNLYAAVCRVAGQPPRVLSSAEITSNALSGADVNCVKTLECFCSFLGGVAGNLALTFGARGGVYIAGGIVPRFISFLKESAFVDRFGHKGVMSEYVKNIPISVITNTHVGLIGAAVWIERKYAES
ncbi:MAG: glucokinase [Agarilytica sp.]